MQLFKSAGPAAIAAMAVAAPASAHPEPSFPPPAHAALLTPLTFVKVHDLDFGTIIATGVAGTVTIDAVTGANTASAGIALFGGPTGERGYFAGAGAAGQQVVLALTPATALDDGLGNSLAVLSMSLDGPNTRTIGPGQTFEVFVGGVIRVEADQAAGIYSATFDLTADFQ